MKKILTEAEKKQRDILIKAAKELKDKQRATGEIVKKHKKHSHEDSDS